MSKHLHSLKPTTIVVHDAGDGIHNVRAWPITDREDHMVLPFLGLEKAVAHALQVCRLCPSYFTFGGFVTEKMEDAQ